MVTPISLECPHCNQEADVFLSTDATFVILNCPQCLKHLIYHDNTCSVLNRQQVNHIIQAHQDGSVERILQDIAQRARAKVAIQDGSEMPELEPVLCGVPRKAVDGRRPISQDDLMNLRIELATCRDSAEFIGRL